MKSPFILPCCLLAGALFSANVFADTTVVCPASIQVQSHKITNLPAQWHAASSLSDGSYLLSATSPFPGQWYGETLLAGNVPYQLEIGCLYTNKSGMIGIVQEFPGTVKYQLKGSFSEVAGNKFVKSCSGGNCEITIKQ